MTYRTVTSPFVMNGKEELVRAVDDYREGRNGRAGLKTHRARGGIRKIRPIH
jgi:hypothetical protein